MENIINKGNGTRKSIKTKTKHKRERERRTKREERAIGKEYGRQN
jgi:hypothetical protein